METKEEVPKTRRSFNLFCLKTRNDKEVVYYSRVHRWAIYLTGFLESVIFSACILGWSQLVFVLKNEEIFLDLCQSFSHGKNASYYEYNALNLSSSTTKEELILTGCEEQDQAFALIYVLASIVFVGTSIFSGMMLHYCGLVITRIVAILLIIVGFLSLGYVSKENTSLLYLSMILLAYGGNQLRLSGYQFCNLFPKYRGTALTIISGAYTTSAGLFLIYQLGQQYHMSIKVISFGLTGLTLLSLVATVIMPWHSVLSNDAGHCTSKEPPLLSSLLSFSSFTHAIWLSIHLGSAVFFALYFNSWISQIAQTNDEAGFYSLLYSFICLACFAVTPFPGLVMDFLYKKAEKAPSEEERLVLKLKSPSGPLIFVTFVSIGLIATLFFRTPFAVYLGLVFLMLLRAFVMAVGNSFVAIRFPGGHFDRLTGIYTSLTTIIIAVQYPFFVWIQKQFTAAMSTLIFIMILSLFHPLHLLIDSYVRKIAKKMLSFV
ncbi:UNVERIFIED_CONTAM: hypothetical protein RMT77_006500 [Armadillidium vulgare]